MQRSFSWPTATYQSAPLHVGTGESPVTERQDQIKGFSTAALAAAHVVCVGAGGLGGLSARSFARKGVGHLTLVDHDVVEASNLARQVFYLDDLDQPKALRLARTLAAENYTDTCTYDAHYTAFTRMTAGLLITEDVSVVCCGVDNDQTRAIASVYCRERGIPCVFSGVDEESVFGWVFVQEATGPCLGCIFPSVAKALGEPQPCRASPASIDILQLVTAIVQYAVDTLLMGRQRRWNFRSVHLMDGDADVHDIAEKRDGCALCVAKLESS